MKKIAQTQLVFSAMLLIFVSACTEPIPIGTDLVEQDQADIRFIDTFTIVAKTIAEDSVRIFDPNPQVQFDHYLCGNLNDPVFGSVTADLYIQFRNITDTPPELDGGSIDSIILKLEYDSAGIYGDLNALQRFEVYEIDELIDNDTSYFSNQQFMTKNVVLGEKNFRPRFRQSDSLTVFTYTSGDTLTSTLAPHLRINLHELNTEIADLLFTLGDDDYESDNFISVFNGLSIRAINTTETMLSFDLSSSSVSGMTLYYKNSDGELAQYEYSIFNPNLKHSNIRHDFTGTPIANAFDSKIIGDSILYLQGMSGPNIEVEIPYANVLKDQVIVNKAELIFTIESAIDDPIFAPSDQLILTRRNEDDVLVVIPDVSFAISRNDLGLFGGSVESSTNASGSLVNTYALNISSHLQSIIDEDLEDPAIILRSFPKQERGSRVVLYGPNHSRYPVELKVTYTNLGQ